MNIKARSVLRFIIIFAKLTCTWPSNDNGNFFKRFIKQFQWWLSIINIIGLLIPLLLGAYHYRHETIELMKVLSESTALMIVFFNLIFFRWQEKQLRILFDEVVHFVMTIEGEKNVILQKWVNRYIPIWIFGIILFFLAAVFFAFGPFITLELLPATTWYPFEIKQFTMLHYFLFMQHGIAIFQTGLGITTDITISFLFCYSSVKLEVLKNQIGISRKSEAVIYCFNQHEECIRFFKQLSVTARLMMLKNNLLMMITIICGAIPLLSNEPLAESSQFISIVTTSYLRIYMNVWPADDVREMSQNTASAFYECSWIGAPKSIQRSVNFAICRAQKPLIVSIPGLLPPITLQFYANFVSTTLSYFTALRAVIGH